MIYSVCFSLPKWLLDLLDLLDRTKQVVFRGHRSPFR